MTSTLTLLTSLIRKAWTVSNPKVGYVQGMSFLAALLVLNIPEPALAYRSFVHLLAIPPVLDFFVMKFETVHAHCEFFSFVLARFMPQLAAHFTAVRLVMETLLVDWFMTVFSNCLPLEVVSRVWDNLFLHGESYIYRVGISLLKCLESDLLRMDFDGLMLTLTHPLEISEERLFSTMEGVKLGPDTLQALKTAKTAQDGPLPVPTQPRSPKPKVRVVLGQQATVRGKEEALGPGTVRFIGPLLVPGRTGTWAGLELKQPLGRNDGSLEGHSYFRCAPNYGVFVPVSAVRPLTLSPPASPTQTPKSAACAEPGLLIKCIACGTQVAADLIDKHTC